MVQALHIFITVSLGERQTQNLSDTTLTGQAEAMSPKLHLLGSGKGPSMKTITFCFPRHITGSWIRSGGVATNTDGLMWDVLYL